MLISTMVYLGLLAIAGVVMIACGRREEKVGQRSRQPEDCNLKLILRQAWGI